MLNSAPLNSAPLNSLGGGGSETVVLTPGAGFAWRWAVTLAGVDVSSKITGAVRIESSEDGDRVASFALWLGMEAVSIGQYTGQAVTIDFVVAGDPEIVDRRFTGFLVQPEFDILSRVLACTGTTRLPDTTEAMELAEIDMFFGGQWSVDVFEETAGRSRWDYAQERLSTRPASLNADRQGQPRVTPWRPAGIAYEFAPQSTIYQSLDISLATLSETTNVIELELDYRYSRYRERKKSYSWQHPGTSGSVGVTGLQNWRADSSELPDIDMVIDAVESAGWFVTYADWYRLPGDLPELTPPWGNENIDLLLGADFTAAVRWSQRAVERYRVRLEVPGAVAAVGEVIRRERVVLDTDAETDRLWEESGQSVVGSLTGTDTGGSTDNALDNLLRRDQARLDAAGNTALARSATELLQAQRGNVVSWQIPLAHALGIDHGQALLLNDQGALVSGAVVNLNEEGDPETGYAMLTVSVAVSLGDAAAVADGLALPAAPTFVDDPAPSVSGVLPTQLIKDPSSPEYDEELPGFAGSYSVGTWDPADRYPRRFAVNTPEIPAQWRDEIIAEQSVTIRVAPPADQLEV